MSKESKTSKYEFDISFIDGLKVIAINGKLDSSNSDEAESELNSMLELENENRYYIFSLGKLEYISSAGLRVFLSASKKIKNNQGNLVLCEVSEDIIEIFDMTGLSNIFTLCPSLEAAIEKIKSAYL